MGRKKGTFTSRTRARKRAADVIFEANLRRLDTNPQAIRDLLEERRVITAAETGLPPYAVQIVEGVADSLGQLDQLLAKRAKVSSLDRLPGVDLAIMRVAVWEMIYNSEEVSPIVAISEAVAIAKSISTERSPAFVNAVLDSVRRDLADEPVTAEMIDETLVPIVPAVPVVDAESGTLATAAFDPADEDLDELLGEY